MRSVVLFVVSSSLLNPGWAASAQTIPFKSAEVGTPWSTAGLALLFVSALAIAAVLLIRRRLAFAPAAETARLLRVLETQRLGPRSTLTVIEFKGGHYLLAQTEHGVRCLAGPDAGATT
jgi:flagellar biogenesis protein FliO